MPFLKQSILARHSARHQELRAGSESGSAKYKSTDIIYEPLPYNK